MPYDLVPNHTNRGAEKKASIAEPGIVIDAIRTAERMDARRSPPRYQKAEVPGTVPASAKIPTKLKKPPAPKSARNEFDIVLHSTSNILLYAGQMNERYAPKSREKARVSVP